MLVIKNYEGYNPRRYSNPWVAKVNSNAKISFSERVGGYTGGYNTGEPGQLYIEKPIDGQVYAYGKKDYRGSNSYIQYIKILDGKVVEISKQELIKNLQGE